MQRCRGKVCQSGLLISDDFKDKTEGVLTDMGARDAEQSATRQKDDSCLSYTSTKQCYYQQKQNGNLSATVFVHNAQVYKCLL